MDAREWIAEHESELVEDICTLVRIPSVSVTCDDPEAPFGRPCRECLDETLRLGERMGFEAINHENYCGSLLWHGETETEIGLFGHTDVVPAGSGWQYQPFEPTVQDGLIIGRGASDNKGSFMAALYALRYLKENGTTLRHTVRFFLGCNEEKGMEDVQYYTEHYAQPAFSLVPDVMFPVCNGEKGIMEIDLKRVVSGNVLQELESGIMSNAVPAHAEALLALNEVSAQALRESPAFVESGAVLAQEGNLWRIIVEGIGAHAAFPEGSDSAEVKLARCLLAAEILDEPGKELMQFIVDCFSDYYGAGLNIAFSDEASGRLTHVGGMASYKDGAFVQNVNIRYNVTAQSDVILANIKDRIAAYGFEIAAMHGSGPCYTDAESPVVKRLVAICNEELGTNVSAYVMGGGTYSRRLKNAVGYGPGIPGKEKLFGTERGGAHQPDEYMEIAHLRRAFLVYVRAIPELDALID